MSHGVPRPQPTTADRNPETLSAELKDITNYRALVTSVTTAVTTAPDSPSTFDLTSKLLTRNPEYYTIWNHRRRILTRLFTRPWDSSGPDATRRSIQDDLTFLMPLLMKYPKCYWIWNHRLWLLRSASAYLPGANAGEIWAAELGLVGKMLQRDGRNFHGWDYRRVVVRQLLSGADEEAGLKLREAEFAYTTKMIRANLSNFSAWHYRSRLIPELLASRGASAPDRRKLFDSELVFVKDALIDPYDQSLWFYHQHLVSVLLTRERDRDNGWRPWVEFTNHDREEILGGEVAEIREMLEDPNTHDCKWIYQSLLEYAGRYLEIEGAATQLVTTIEMRGWLKSLRELDPLRAERWNDLEHQLGL
ncbi:MAG: Rab geranylgeranyltransferase [Chrysothrix sp. TS-e1954]|nr:MAG: Rab geranylgeranyltransferase [Chrysothrix sp. TS-e1954]